MRKVLILTDLKGWHYSQLYKSFQNNNVTVESACLEDLSIRVEESASKVFLNNKELSDFTDVFVRHVPGGTLEQVIINLNILKIFESNNINVMNTSESIETTVDKSLTSIRLKEANLLTPKTWIFRDIDSSIENTKNLLKKHSLIYKPLFGSQGENIVKISNINDFNKISNDSSIYYIQEFLETEPSHDYRVLVIKSGSSYNTYTMVRYGNSYINNYSKGGKCVSVKFDKDLIDVAIKAAQTINIPFCGVDIIKSNDKNYIIEVNSIPAWRGMQSIINENISDQIVNSFLNHNVKETNISIQK